MFGFTRTQTIAFVVMLVLIALAPFFLYPVFLMRVLCMALFACAFNLMLGYVGLLSFGHAAYFGMGAYITAWTMKFWHVDASVAIALGGLTGAILGLCLGYLAIRRSGIYFAMITLALAQMVYFFCLQAPFTGGEDGIQQVPRGKLFGFIDLSNDMTMYWLVAAIFLGGFTSESLGDYCAGPNHVLPTSSTARFSSPLGVYDFQKRSSLIEVSEQGAQVLGQIASVLAHGEGLQAHARAAEMRLKS